MAKSIRKRTRETMKIENVLSNAFPKAKVDAYSYNPHCIRVRMIDPSFKGETRVERDDKVWPVIQTLPEDTLSKIVSLLLLAPNETKKSPANMEFEHPEPSLL